MNDKYSAQLANRGHGTIHVQVKGSKFDFLPAIQRSYGAAFEVDNDALMDAVEERKATLPSMAGTDRRYVPATLVPSEDGFLLQLAGEAPKGIFAATKGIFGGCGGSKSGIDPVTIEVSDDEVSA